jgi:hypothetical protein
MHRAHDHHRTHALSPAGLGANIGLLTTAVNTLGEKMKRWLALAAVAAITIVVAAVVPTAQSSESTARLVRVTSPVSRGDYATLTARVRPSRTCSITVYYKSGPSSAQGLYPKRPRLGRVSWTWKVGTRTTPGRWPIRVRCGSAGSFRTSFVVTY